MFVEVALALDLELWQTAVSYSMGQTPDWLATSHDAGVVCPFRKPIVHRDGVQTRNNRNGS
jgi:hypothetical protein